MAPLLDHIFDQQDLSPGETAAPSGDDVDIGISRSHLDHRHRLDSIPIRNGDISSLASCRHAMRALPFLSFFAGRGETTASKDEGEPAGR